MHWRDLLFSCPSRQVFTGPMQANGVVKAVCSPKRSPSVGSVSSSELANGDDQANGGETAVPARVSPAVHASPSAMPGHMPPAPGSPLAKAGPSADGEGKSLLGGTALELAALRQQVAMLESRLREADRTRQMWEACMTTLVGSILLGPEMNEMCAAAAAAAANAATTGRPPLRLPESCVATLLFAGTSRSARACSRKRWSAWSRSTACDTSSAPSRRSRPRRPSPLPSPSPAASPVDALPSPRLRSPALAPPSPPVSARLRPSVPASQLARTSTAPPRSEPKPNLRPRASLSKAGSRSLAQSGSCAGPQRNSPQPQPGA